MIPKDKGQKWNLDKPQKKSAYSELFLYHNLTRNFEIIFVYKTLTFI